ncbi:uncharacterized protein [Montipora capricornis]|uniref:uncharacterized protein n=1 Tax=Montipora capricornis TaxID=246305 RepID=UPI0035F19273
MDLSHFVALQQGPTLNLIQWLQNRSLLANPLRCAQCNMAMDLKEKNVNHIDGFHWRCSGCRKKRSLRTRSFFEEFPKVALEKLLLVVYFFAREDSQRRISRHLGLNAGLASNICRKLQDVCSRDLEDRPFTPFGGPGMVVKCDESKFNHKAKYNRGRRAARDTWVFGMVTTEFSPARGYFEVVDRRDAATLHPIISRCVRPGTEVHTDDWASYRNLDQRINNVGAHQVVVHRRHFVDPATGVHTQEIESCWNNLKLGLKTHRGMSYKTS